MQVCLPCSYDVRVRLIHTVVTAPSLQWEVTCSPWSARCLELQPRSPALIPFHRNWIAAQWIRWQKLVNDVKRNQARAARTVQQHESNGHQFETSIYV